MNGHKIHILKNTNFGGMFIHPRSHPQSPNKEASMVLLLCPLFRIGQWFGIFSLNFDKNNPEVPIVLKRKSFNYIRALFALFLGTIYCGFHFYSIVHSLIIGRRPIDILGQSLWLQAAFLAYLVSLQIFINPEPIIKLYTEDWKQVELSCGRAFSSEKVKKFARRMILLYIGLILASSTFVFIHSIGIPNYPAYPIHILFEWRNSSSPAHIGESTESSIVVSTTEILVNSLVQLFFMFWKWTGAAMLDVTLVVYGYVIVATMGSLDSQIKNFHQRNSDLANESINGEMDTKKKIDSADPMETTNNQSQLSNSIVLRKFLQDFHTIAQLLRDTNDVFGALLLIDFGHLILMICSLIILPIKYYSEFETDSILIFGGNAFVFITRLVILTLTMGDVYPAGTEINIKIARVMTEFQLETQLLNPILGHLSVFSATPICFNAWGFFPITRGTLLAVLSVISTYIVVLLQVN